MWADWSTTSLTLLPFDCGLWGMGAGEMGVPLVVYSYWNLL